MTGGVPNFEWRPGVPVEDQEDPDLQDDFSIQLEEPQVDFDNNVQKEQEQVQIVEGDIQEHMEDLSEVSDNSEDKVDSDDG